MLDRVGVDVFSVILYEPAGWTYLGGWSEANLYAWLELQKQFPERVVVFGTVDFGRVAKEPEFFSDIILELERGVRRGMQGIKIWKNLGMHYRDADGKLCSSTILGSIRTGNAAANSACRSSFTRPIRRNIGIPTATTPFNIRANRRPNILSMPTCHAGRI